MKLLRVFKNTTPRETLLWPASGSGVAINGFGDGSSRLSSGGLFRSSGRGRSGSSLEIERIFFPYQFPWKCFAGHLMAQTFLSVSLALSSKYCKDGTQTHCKTGFFFGTRALLSQNNNMILFCSVLSWAHQPKKVIGSF